MALDACWPRATPTSSRAFRRTWGLMDSTDGVRWEGVTLAGEADFHALVASDDRVYGRDSVNERFLASEDGGESFSARAVPEPLHWLAVDPGDPDHVFGATEAMLYASGDGGRSWRSLGRDGGLLAWPAGGDAVLLEGTSGRVLRSQDGRSWQGTGAAPFDDAVAVTATGDADLAVVTEGGELWVSEDAGASWTKRASVSEIPG